ncbi:putative inactive receptor kinase RLK902 [Platanthera guangdongensis]|uniref:Inactive receptor kinase RLK902 n=1 Tax=Platanthera guangdongensis TaxID=2320717 RepID=A0ABR2MDQ4_9ASPA
MTSISPAMCSGHRTMDMPLILLLLILRSFSPVSGDLVGDGAALMAFRSAVGRFVLPWNTTVSPCRWPGVSCAGDRVFSLHLPGSGLIGEIPAGSLGNLSNLQTLSLRFNALSGPLPADIAGCKQLRNLYLQRNRFSGEIPSFLSSLSSLVRLNLAGNNFSGGIPLALNNLTRLGTLYLEDNRLSGEIPELNLPNLVQFNLSFNLLNGSVPSKLRSMPANSFMGMSLCGGSLTPCLSEISPAESPAGTASSDTGRKLSGGAIAGIAIGTVTVFLIIAVILFLLCRRKGKSGTSNSVEPKPREAEAALTNRAMTDGFETNGVPPTAKPASATPTKALASTKQLVFFGNGPRSYDLQDLLRASAEILGKGTFGTTYKAVLETGSAVAVKRLRDGNYPENEFRERIEAIGAMNHPNLVPLQSYFLSRDEKLLVYEFMAMGSLSSLLHGNRGSGRTPLNWEARTDIALAAARGIDYIHSTSSAASHGNIKSSNILLSGSSEARVSDHGLAHLAGTATASNRVAGYRAPEVTDTRRVSQKADVYSFGVLLLELLTGKAPTHAVLDEEGVDLPRWVQSVVREEWTAEVFDIELLRYQNAEEEMVQMLQLGVNCTAQFPDQRPAMPAVVARIEEIHFSAIDSGKE